MDRRSLLLGAGGFLGIAGAVAGVQPASAAPSAGPLGIVSVADYGAVGDGATDSTAAIIAAIAAVAARNVAGDACGIVWFPSGAYLCSQPLTVPKRIKLVGESMEASKLIYSGAPGGGAFITFGASSGPNVACGVVGMQVNANNRLPWALLMFGPQEGSSISGAHICGGITGGADVRSAGISGGSNKFVVEKSWIWTYGDGGTYGLKFDDANGPLAIRDTTCVGIGRSTTAPAGSAGLYFNGGYQHVSDVNVENFESHSSIDGWSNYSGDTLSAYNGVTNVIRRRSYGGADPAVRFSIQNIDSSGTVNTVKDEHAGVVIARAKHYANRQIDSAAYNGAHLTIGPHHLWVDASGRLRIKSSAPTADTDGVVVGAQG